MSKKVELGRKTFAVREVLLVEKMVCGELLLGHKLGKGGKSFVHSLIDGPNGSYHEEKILKELGAELGDKLEVVMTFRVIK